MTERLVPSSFLYRFSIPCQEQATIWSERGAALPESARLPHLGALDDRTTWADVRAAWNKSGMSFSVLVAGKKQSIWCRDARVIDSDGVQIVIDTRDVHDVHRASRFCHRFAFLPSGGGRQQDEPVAVLLGINRARESPRPIPPGMLKVRCERRLDGYLLEAHIPAAALTGFDPSVQPRLGFMYAVMDRELGWQTLSVGPEFPLLEDPSFWPTLELISSR